MGFTHYIMQKSLLPRCHLSIEGGKRCHVRELDILSHLFA